MADNLLGFDPAELQQMMAQFGATEKDKKDANSQALFALGFGLLGGRKGQELATIGQAGMGAMDYRQKYLMQQQQQKMQALQQGAGLMKLGKDMAMMNMGMKMLNDDGSQP